MYQIGQFAKLMDISPRMLRHYEKAGIFVPNEIDKKQDIAIIAHIKFLY
ncbi:MerR family DNA-binding transcriptional regulator [Enterococcus faecalis]|nr:MerR family DNA-binding transcriptional regulator [Enterococcus faecalis]EGO2584367.1 MerR family DNA-binding transcriptional regulator [Enterococcus faecalis]EGO2590487.1 MerR family DNA-binding transcriptional regulator [Enterococcus faecalis]EGO2815890.1 MerR family DNA-binding transcriptional regulator [Enterococcus faecalis]EGO9371307.1 MerR family DNA-binding transcriptional regulator [Enterococcus faecalis]EGS8055496.1 MerR family DNA-binding transcriptional regulator [Enterococcus f